MRWDLIIPLILIGISVYGMVYCFVRGVEAFDKYHDRKVKRK